MTIFIFSLARSMYSNWPLPGDVVARRELHLLGDRLARASATPPMSRSRMSTKM